MLAWTQFAFKYSVTSVAGHLMRFHFSDATYFSSPPKNTTSHTKYTIFFSTKTTTTKICLIYLMFYLIYLFTRKLTNQIQQQKQHQPQTNCSKKKNLKKQTKSKKKKAVGTLQKLARKISMASRSSSTQIELSVQWTRAEQASEWREQHNRGSGSTSTVLERERNWIITNIPHDRKSPIKQLQQPLLKRILFGNKRWRFVAPQMANFLALVLRFCDFLWNFLLSLLLLFMLIHNFFLELIRILVCKQR